MSRIVMLVLGYLFLVLGVAGLFLPFLQGILFLAIGLLLLSRHAAWAQRALEWLKRRHPVMHGTINRADVWITRQGRLLRLRIGRLF